jgi:hypothetical protein
LKAFDLGGPVAELRVTADGRRGLVLAADRPELIELPLDRLPEMRTVHLPAAGVSMAEAGGKLFVACRGSEVVNVLDAGELRTVGAVPLPGRPFKVLSASAPAAGLPRLVVLTRTESTGLGGLSESGPVVAFVLNPADPKPGKGLMLGEGGPSDAALSADGRYLYLWRSDASPSGLAVYDLPARRKVFADARVPGPVRPDAVGLYAATRTGEVYAADFSVRVAKPGPGDGPVIFHPTRPLALQVLPEAGLPVASSSAAAAGPATADSAPAGLLRVLSAGSFAATLELTGLPAGATMASPAFAPSAKLLLWLTPRPADGSPVTGGAGNPAATSPTGVALGAAASGGGAALVAIPFDADKLPAGAAEAFQFATPPPRTAVIGRPLTAKLSTRPEGAAKFAKIAGPAGLTVAADGALSFTPTAEDAGDRTVIVQAVAGTGAPLRLVWTLHVVPATYRLAAPTPVPVAGGTGAVAATPPAPILKLSPDGRELFVFDPESRTITVQDAATGAILRSGRLSAGAVDFEPVGNRLLVLEAATAAPVGNDPQTPTGALLTVDPGTLAVEKSVPLPAETLSPTGLAVPPQAFAADVAFVTGVRGRDRALSVVSPKSGEVRVIGAPTVPGRPESSPDGRFVYVSDAEGRAAASVQVFGFHGTPAEADEQAPPLPARATGRRLIVGPADGRVIIGRTVYSPDLSARLAELPGDLSAPLPRRAVVACLVSDRASAGVRPVIAGTAGTAGGAEGADPRFDAVIDDTAEDRERASLVLLDARGYAEIARIPVTLPAPADDLMIDAAGADALIRCGHEIVRLPLPTESTAAAARLPFELLGRPADRVRAGAEWRFRPTLVEPVPGKTPAFALATGPAGMAVDPATGEAHWRPGSEAVGRHRVVLSARESRDAGPAGRSAAMAFEVAVEPARIDLPDPGPGAGGFGGAALSGDGATLVLWRIGGDRLTLVPVAGGEPRTVDVGPGLSRVFVVGDKALAVVEGSDTLRAVDLGRAAAAGGLLLKGLPVQVLRRPGTAEVYAATEAGSIHRINLETLVDEGVAARGRTFAFDPTGNRMYCLTPAGRLGFEPPEPVGGAAAGGMVLIGGKEGRDGSDDDNVSRAAGSALKVIPVSPAGSGAGAAAAGGRGGRRGGFAWTVWTHTAAPAKPAFPGAGALRPGVRTEASPPDAMMFGGPGSPWLLTDAVAADDAPDSLAVSADGSMLLVPSEAGVRALRSGDPASLRAAIPLPGPGGFPEPAVSVVRHPSTGAVLALGRSGRVYSLRADTEPPVFEPVPAAALPPAMPGGYRPGGTASPPRQREIILGGPGAGTVTGSSASAGPLLAVAETVPLAVAVRGREAVRFDTAAPAVPDALRPLPLEGRPPTDYTPGELFRFTPKVVGAVEPLHRSLRSGPEGMLLNPATGTLVWDPPPAGGPEAVRISLLFKDKTGRTAFHSFVLLRSAPAGEREK